MSHLAILNNVTHKDILVKTEYSADLGDNISSTLTFMTEFAEVQKEYPILFRQNSELPGGDYQAVVLYGIVKDENLFLAERHPEQRFPGWRGNYIPAVSARGPFSIVYQRQVEAGDMQVNPLIQVDLSHAKVSSNEGQALFLPQGGNSPYLDTISATLNIIRDGMQLEKPMFAAFCKYDLIESVTIDIDLINQEKHQVRGFYTINADKLSALSGEALEDLARPGFLQAAYFVVASLSNIQRLISLKNQRLSNLDNN